MPVRFRLHARPEREWRVNLVPAGDGWFLLYLNGTVRRATTTKVGDAVAVAAAFDDDYRRGPAHPMPAELRRGLVRGTPAARNWQRLSPSRKKELVRYLATLRSESARARNVARALHVLGGGSGRFLGREWRDGG